VIFLSIRWSNPLPHTQNRQNRRSKMFSVGNFVGILEMLFFFTDRDSVEDALPQACEHFLERFTSPWSFQHFFFQCNRRPFSAAFHEACQWWIPIMREPGKMLQSEHGFHRFEKKRWFSERSKIRTYIMWKINLRLVVRSMVVPQPTRVWTSGLTCVSHKDGIFIQWEVTFLSTARRLWWLRQFQAAIRQLSLTKMLIEVGYACVR
jgi:hypothetical protein